MNAGHFEQISDCWLLEEQPATYYRTAAARARMLQADATTPRVRQYLDMMIAHCERLAGGVEPGVPVLAGDTRGGRDWPDRDRDFTGISPNSPRRRGGVVQGSRLDQWAGARFDETNPLSRKRR